MTVCPSHCGYFSLLLGHCKSHDAKAQESTEKCPDFPNDPLRQNKTSGGFSKVSCDVGSETQSINSPLVYLVLSFTTVRISHRKITAYCDMQNFQILTQFIGQYQKTTSPNITTDLIRNVCPPGKLSGSRRQIQGFQSSHFRSKAQILSLATNTDTGFDARSSLHLFLSKCLPETQV